MKNWHWIPLAGIVGLVFGSWGPREDLKALREKMHEERTGRTAAAVGFDAFARMTGIPDAARARNKKSAGKAQFAAGGKSDGQSATNAVVAATEKPRKSDKERFRQQLTKEDLRVRIDEAAELWRTRVDLATVQWKQTLGLSEGKGSESFDSALASMNESLRDAMQAMADEIAAVGKVTPELGLRLMGDASRIMAETYDALGAAVPENRRSEVSDLPVFEFVDPSVAEPLIGVQDKLDGGFMGNRR